jgi:hypothetical protein
MRSDEEEYVLSGREKMCPSGSRDCFLDIKR